jgi:alginate O-acetyltransferase complex protein AlgI
MLFNSFLFVFLFLPVSLVGYYIAAAYRTRLAAAWLVVVSFVFYGYWSPIFVVLLAASILGNYGIGRLLQAYASQSRVQSAILTFGITANLLLLFYYKYLAFAFSLLARSGLRFDLDTSGILLPLGISFFTFTQIGYLIDCRTGIAKDRRILDYALFVTFFPHLIAGPILHHREMMPQFENPSTYKLNWENIAVGLTIFVIGLAKKVAIADQLAPGSNLGFQWGSQLGFAPTWSAVLTYSMQLYFDFSGYSDMAIGLARMFGIRFPANFNSPYKANNIIAFWQRWHMTLTRYLTLYLYNPIALWVTRKRAAAGKPIAASGASTPRGFTSLVAFPTIVTMFLAGVWHGAGTQFAVYGLLHAGYLTINHGWRIFGPTPVKNPSPLYRAASLTICVAATYLAVLVGWVFFRAASSSDAVAILQGMMGMRGWMWGTKSMADQLTIEQIALFLLAPAALIKLLICHFIVFAAPNTSEVLARYDPILGKVRTSIPTVLQWRPTVPWGMAVGTLATIAVLYLAGATEFLYFQF